jgi:DNA-binding GntR family transcriptional regulator
MASTATRAETVADKVRAAIKRGLYMGGERLIEQNLATQMNVSQNTIRDALRILEGEGWVFKTARYGVHVRSFTALEAEELYTLWAAVESLALRWAIQSLSKSGLGQLRRLVQDARKQALLGDTEAATEILFALHKAIGELSGRPQTVELLATLHNRAYLLEIVRRNRAPRSLHAYQAQIIFYEKLLSLMEAGDTDAAHELLAYLIHSDGEALKALLSER